MLSSSAEDYLKEIYKLQDAHDVVSTSAIAERLKVSAASVTNMVKKLAEMSLVTHVPYQGITLTEGGQKIALEVIRHHRLLELYLSQAMGYSWDKVDEEAERLEHVISEEFEDKIDEMLGFPTEDPHGSPIPTKDGLIDKRRYRPLVEAPTGASVIVRRVPDSDPDLLRYLGELGLTPTTTVEVLSREPFDGPVKIRVGESEHHLGHQVASCILVSQGSSERQAKR